MEEAKQDESADFKGIDAMTDNSAQDARIYTPDHTYFTVCKALLAEIEAANILDKDSASAFKEIDEENGFNNAQLGILENVIWNSRRVWRILGLIEQVKRGEIAKKIIKEELGL